uniref:Uncharacterized protein n=2 Tax=Rhodnius prolixus TaxID=13249 RepID=T1I7A6_RHOPR
MDLQLVQEIQSYNHHGQERRTGVQLLKEIDVINSDFNNWLNVVQKQKEKALHELEDTNVQLREVEQMRTNLNSNVTCLERMIEEKKCETKKLDGLKQQYLLRRGKATARLSQLDVDFIDSLQ